MSYVTISLWNATEWSDEMEALARKKYVLLVTWGRLLSR